jgi:hypothetical protein
VLLQHLFGGFFRFAGQFQGGDALRCHRIASFTAWSGTLGYFQHDLSVEVVEAALGTGVGGSRKSRIPQGLHAGYGAT